MIFVQSHEVAERHGESNLIGHIERVEAQRLFQTHDDERETERVKTRIQESKVVRQSRELALLFQRYLLELRRNRGSYRHFARPSCTDAAKYTKHMEGHSAALVGEKCVYPRAMTAVFLKNVVGGTGIEPVTPAV
jgi:hypothetical protein